MQNLRIAAELAPPIGFAEDHGVGSVIGFFFPVKEATHHRAHAEGPEQWLAVAAMAFTFTGRSIPVRVRSRK